MVPYSWNKCNLSLLFLDTKSTNLSHRNFFHIFPICECPIPLKSSLYCLIDAKSWFPSEYCLRLCIIEKKKSCLVHSLVFLDSVLSFSEYFYSLFHNIFYTHCIRNIRTKIVRSKVFIIQKYFLPHHEISRKWLKNMLPRTDRIRIAQSYRFSFLKSTNNIWNKTFYRPIPSSDNISCTDRNNLLFSMREK